MPAASHCHPQRSNPPRVATSLCEKDHIAADVVTKADAPVMTACDGLDANRSERAPNGSSRGHAMTPVRHQRERDLFPRLPGMTSRLIVAINDAIASG